MSPLWVLPLVVLALGAVAVAMAARRLAVETAGLRPGLDDLRRLGQEAGLLLEELEEVRGRGAEVADLRSRARAARRSLADPGRGGDDR